NRVARVRVGKGDKLVTYEEVQVPHYTAHCKGWLSLHAGCLVDQLILKRWANQLEICVLVLRQLPAHNFYFLVGYSETLLSHFYKCPVRLHLQTVPSKVVYKYI
ncbi:small ribosomal subunit protein uS3m-like, partial [Callorhinus ursinus]|uniref:28S ribosomal protein S24, mitochondrial-like n=1 Tax=Callorhinus ursinus TaxID=34884 RepID=A0A3Q7NUF5_CALUR